MTIASPPHTKIVCAHCGYDCPSTDIRIADQYFCCEGCKMVYQLLNENGLTQYYKIQKGAGISLKSGGAATQFDYLDNETIVQQLIDFEDDKIIKVTFYLPQIHCSACLWLLEHLYQLNPSIVQSRVNFLKKELYLTFLKSEITLRAVVELLATIGYAPEINLNSLEAPKAKQTDRTFLYKLGVAGFCFGNIMLVSFPEYLGLNELIDQAFYRFFSYLNIVLILPVLLYSATGYFKATWVSFRERQLGIDVPITLGISVLFLRSIFEIVTQTGVGYLDSLAGLVFFLLIGKWFQQRTYHQLSFDRDYTAYFPIAALKKTIDGAVESVALSQLQKGDVILVKNETLIPADGVIIKGDAQIDYSFVTGESKPIRKEIGDKVYAGGRQKGTQIEVQLTKKVSQSYLTQLWNEETFNTKQTTDFSTLLNRVGRYFTWVILGIAFVTGGYWLWMDSTIAMNAFTAVLIIACPCAIALSVPFTLGNAIRILSKHGFYLKNTTVVERLRGINTIVFDKTGTLTAANTHQLTYHGTPLTPEEKQAIKAVAYQSTHPISQSLVNYFQTIKPNHQTHNQPIRNFQAYIGKGIEGGVGEDWVQIGSSDFVQSPHSKKGTYIKINHTIKGYFTLAPTHRKGIFGVIQRLKKRYRIALLSGDNSQSKQQWQPLFEETALHFNQSPKDKLTYIRDLQQKGQRVMMLGDGLNDAGALKQSDVGIAVTENVQHFSPACDAILEGKQLNRLEQLIQFSHTSVRMVHWALLLSFCYNLVGLYFAVQGLLTPVIAAILMPLSSISIVAFGVLMTNWAGRFLKDDTAI